MFEMENPFRFGTIVTGRDFVDREKELGEMARELRSGESIVLYSRRRMGKSSLLTELARRYQKECIFVYVDLYGMTNRNRFLEVFAKNMVEASFGRAEKLVSGLRELLKSVSFRFVSERGEIAVEFARTEPTREEVDQIFDLPERIAARKRKRVVVMFDEFQEASSLDGVSLIKIMRSRFQFQKGATYVFCGSKRHLLYQIFEEREGAFFRFARPMELGPIPTDEFEEFIVRKFSEAGGRISRENAKRIVEASGGYPYYVQQISHELFDITKMPGSPQDVEMAIDATVEHQSPAYSVLWDSIKSRLQRKYLVALALEPQVPHGLEFVTKYGLKSRSHVQRVERQLEARGIVETGQIVDTMFARWLIGLFRSS